MKKLIAPVLLLLILGGIVGSMIWVHNNRELNEKGETIIIIDGEKIYQSDYDTFLSQILNAYGLQEEDLDDETRAEIHQDIINALIENKLIINKARNLGLVPNDDKIDSVLEEIKLDFDSENDFQEALLEAGLTIDELRKQIKEGLAYDNYIEYIILNLEDEKSEITEEDIVEYYEMAFGEDEELRPELEEVREIIISLLSEPDHDKILEVINDLREQADIQILID